MDSVLENIGDTPLVKLNKIPASEGLQCEFCKFACPPICYYCDRAAAVFICL